MTRLARLLLSRLLAGGAGGGASAFSPLDIAGLVAWYDFSDISTLFQDSAMSTPVTADGDPIGGVTDKSGNGNHATQGTTSLKPLWKDTFNNGLGGMLTDGTDDFIQTVVLSVTNPLAFFMVIRREDGNGGRVFAQRLEGPAVFDSGSPTIRRRVAFGANLDDGNADGNIHIWGAKVNGASSELYIDGALTSGNAGTSGISDYLRIGRGQSGDYYGGRYGDLIIVQGIPAEFDDVLDYLNSKWAVY